MTLKRRWLFLPCIAVLAYGCSTQDAAQLAAKAAQAEQAEKAKVDEAQLANRWNSLSTEIPQIVDVVQARVDLLNKKQTLPEGVNPDDFKIVKEAADTMTHSWQQALGAFANSNMAEAVSQAQVAKDKGSEVMQTLRIPPVS